LNDTQINCSGPQYSLNDIVPFQLAAPGLSVIRKPLLIDIEVAEYLSVSVSTVRRWRLRGGGPRWIRIGSSIRYPAAGLHAFVVGLPSGGGAEAMRVN
jgi:excisionase family DNA binding protein